MESEWLPALAGGVRTAGYPAIADRIWRARATDRAIDVRMAFYGYHYLMPDRQGEDPGDLDEAEAVIAEQLALQWLERAASRAFGRRRKPPPCANTPTSAMRSVRRRPVLAWSCAARSTASPGCAGFPYGFDAARFVVKSLTQVTRYFGNEEIRSAAAITRSPQTSISRITSSTGR